MDKVSLRSSLICGAVVISAHLFLLSSEAAEISQKDGSVAAGDIKELVLWKNETKEAEPGGFTGAPLPQNRGSQKKVFSTIFYAANGSEIEKISGDGILLLPGKKISVIEVVCDTSPEEVQPLLWSALESQADSGMSRATLEALGMSAVVISPEGQIFIIARKGNGFAAAPNDCGGQFNFTSVPASEVPQTAKLLGGLSVRDGFGSIKPTISLTTIEGAKNLEVERVEW